MPKLLVLDTEGTGLFRYADPADAEGQPRLASVGFIFVSESGEVEREYEAMAKPDGWTMPAEAMAINGLTNELLNEKGIPVVDILNVFTAAVKEGRTVVAFNVQHDLKQIRAELRRADMPDLFTETPNICVMRPCTNICKILKNNPRTDNDFKFPKLSEALEFFGLTNDAAHTGPADARAALAIYRKLEEMGELPEAKVHFATKRPGDEAPKPTRKRAAKPAKVQADDQIPE